MILTILTALPYSSLNWVQNIDNQNGIMLLSIMACLYNRDHVWIAIEMSCIYINALAIVKNDISIPPVNQDKGIFPSEEAKMRFGIIFLCSSEHICLPVKHIFV